MLSNYETSVGVKMLVDGEVDAIAEMLAKVVDAAIEASSKIRNDPSDLGTTFNISVGYQPALKDVLKGYYRDPIGTALRHGIRDIGRTVAAHATFDELVAICEAAAEKTINPISANAIIGAAWDGIQSRDGQTWSA